VGYAFIVKFCPFGLQVPRRKVTI